MNVEQQPATDWTPAPPVPPAAPSGRSAASWRLLPRSLTGRLVTGVVGLVVIVVLATATGTYFALRSFLYERLDQQVRTSLAQSPQSLDIDQTTTGHPRAPQQLWLVLLDVSGDVAFQPNRNTGAESLQLTPGQRLSLVADVRAAHDRIRTVTTTDGERLRVDARLTTYQGIPVIFTVGLSTDEVDRTLGHLVVLELIIGASAVTLALVASAWGVRFGLRNLYRVTRTAREVAVELSPEGAGLDRRVPVSEPGSEVGQLAESMNTLLSTVETQFAARLESERRMRQFLADASHELRTPLTSIRGYAELARMQRALGPGGVGTDADNLDRIESEGTRMSRLVEDLLTLARGDQGAVPEMEPVDVDDLLDEIVAGSRAAFPEREFRCSSAGDLSVLGDHDQLLRVVRNLVTNAATHTAPDGPIEVRAAAAGPGVVIEVVDAGPGLPPEEAAHVFERFWRADKARTRARGGSGLGLAIVASIVQAHRGTVQFQSTVQGGSTVSVWLPSPPS
jgi:two-component system, OmpR family, sensor kinase